MIRSGLLATIIVAISLCLGPVPGSASEQKSILVTGASSGIGRYLAETLAENGHHVYAGARKDEDLADLAAIDNITAVRLDVTLQEDIDAVVELIRERGTGLYGLVNNAGVGGGDTVISAPIEDQTFIYRVNVEGVYRVTRAFAPLIIEAKGRIATTGSIAGIVAWPSRSAYSGSKHWIEAFTDSLAAELGPQGVSVSVIEPGGYRTNIRRNNAARARELAEQRGGEISAEFKQDLEAAAQRELSLKEPDDVAAAYLHALFDERPLLRYVVVPSAEQQALTIRTQMTELVQLNQWGPYSYSRDELVAMLDEIMNRD